MLRLKWDRKIGNYKVRGGGGRWSMEIGASGRIRRVMCTGWHNLATGGTVNVIDPQAIVDALRTQGWNAAIDGVRIPVDVLTITNLELGYYEPTIADVATKVCPCYIVSAMVGSGTNAIPVEFCCWADATMPQGSIISPADGTTITPGTTVCFVGSGSGVAPLSLRWLDETGQQIGSGPNMCTPINYIQSGDESNSPDRTIELVVKDGLGRETSRYVHLILDNSSDVSDTQLGASLALAPAAPNPASRGTNFSFVLPPSANGARTSLVIHDVAGRTVRTLVDGTQPAARYVVSWDGNDDRGHRVANGTYFARLAVGGEVKSTPVTIVR
ncbi:MAG: FlgD immunoglobulin-like domain containing protein [Candidatus Eisenbacteria bacterium]